MKLIPEWRSAWKLTSVQLNAVAIICDAAFVCVSVFDEKFPIDSVTYVGLRVGLTGAAVVARLIVQEKINDRSK